MNKREERNEQKTKKHFRNRDRSYTDISFCSAEFQQHIKRIDEIERNE